MPDYPPFGSLNPQAPPDTDAMGSIYGVQPPASSVQWLRQYLPQSVGDFLSNREAQALAPTNAREIAGDVISTAGNIMPAGRFGVPRGGMVRLYRGETSLPNEARSIPDWISQNPDFQKTVDATGRWFTRDMNTARYYNQTFGDKTGRVSYVDVPEHEAQGYLASNQPGAGKFSSGGLGGLASEEYFLPRSLADQRVPMPSGIRAYHGSPYDFDRFDISKIGTGEGAQAYGHGLYFAENPSVAQTYKYAFDQSTPKGRAAIWMRDTGGDAGRATSAIQNAIESYSQNPTAGNLKQVADLKAVLAEIQKGEPLGRMYEVNINASPEQFLDWDRPLSAQPQIMERLPMDKIQGALKSYGGLHEPQYVTGEAAYLNLENINRQPGRGHLDQQVTSNYLRDAGIPGIRYLDQGSRSAGQGTNNYVLFRDDIVDILKKWGLIGGMAGAGAAAGSNDQAQAQPFGSLSPKPQTWKPPPG